MVERTTMDPGSWLIVVLAFVVLPFLTRPTVRRLLRGLAERADEWSRSRTERKVKADPEQEKLWLWSKRRRLCAALDRIEHLLATDEWMSATRQLGNRLAYEQLVDELRHTPDAFPASLGGPIVDLWAEPLPVRGRRRSPARGPRDSRDRWDVRDFEAGWSVPTATGSMAHPAAVEVLEIGWRHR
jgi:hypothetical protein